MAAVILMYPRSDRHSTMLVTRSQVTSAANSFQNGSVHPRMKSHGLNSLLNLSNSDIKGEAVCLNIILKSSISRDIGRTFAENTKEAKGINRIGSVTKSYHSYPVEERIGFADWCNRVLGKDKDLKHLLVSSISQSCYQ
jgi:hypothetical protein